MRRKEEKGRQVLRVKSGDVGQPYNSRRGGGEQIKGNCQRLAGQSRSMVGPETGMFVSLRANITVGTGRGGLSDCQVETGQPLRGVQ